MRSNKITVVIPCFKKHQIHLNNVLKSINKQTLLPFEVIVSSSEIDYFNVKEFPNLKIVWDNHTTHCNAASNRNRGSFLCKTPYIKFIDADDEMMPNCLKVTSDFISKFKIDALLSTYGAHDTKKVFNWRQVKHIRNICKTEWIDKKYLNIKNIVLHGHPTVNTNLYQSFLQNESLQKGEDVNFINKLIKNDKKVFIIDYTLTNYNLKKSSRFIT